MRFSIFLSAALLVYPAASSRAGDDVAVVVSGKPMDSVPIYRIGTQVFLEAGTIGRLYGGQVYWYPVSGRVQFTLRGRTMQFVVDSDKATAGADSFMLPAPVKLRTSRAFVPVAFLESEAFARWSGVDARYDAGTRTLEIDRRATVGPIQAFSYRGRTRLSIVLGPGVSYRTNARGVGAVEVSVPYGVTDGEDHVDLDDGVVDSYRLKQDAKQARLTIRFSSKGQRWRASELFHPRRLVVDVYAPGETPTRESEEVPGPAKGEIAVAAVADIGGSSRAVAAAPEGRDALPAASRKKVVVIDPGHGGKDPGATGARGTREKDINLATALELARVLRERGDFRVFLTREDDSFVPLSDRSKKANDLDADLFVSMHCNSSSSRRETGFEVYSVSETASDPEAERLAAVENAALEFEGKNPQDETAKLILLAMTKTEMINESAPFAALVEREVSRRADVPNRGPKQAGFYVLRGTHAPAILIEMAFVSHSRDEAKLNSRRFRRRLAEGVAAGIADYARKKGWLE